ncbi:MFS transporter [Silvanigrella aquatica]|uniref:Major facilitator superfamily (MFS) profile domain-containing protein n=1 Tax=Silvanigrella aquatica TaxID=1915309 RepID=A0A1L4CXD3_9BACT|nr:MFS transporter [Silvanigrella aquatica]APJ02608.1 hypothetical protein AXG55_01125 [Silvanigrella aquatica]
MSGHISKNIFVFFVIFLLIYEFSVYLSNDMIMPAMIDIVNEFSVGDEYISTSLSVFILGAASLQIFLGPLSDRYGRRRFMLFGVFFFILGCFISALSTSIYQFQISRYMQGMGVCYIGVIGYTIIQEMFEEKKAVKIISLMNAISILGPLFGPLAGSLFLEYYNWRGINIVIAFIAIISLFGFYFSFPNEEKLSSFSKITKENSKKISIFYIIINYIDILKNKKFIMGVISFGLIKIPFVVWIAISPLLLIKKAGLSNVEYALCQIPFFGGVIIGILYLQNLLKFYSLNKIIMIGSAILGNGLIAAFLFSILFQEHFLTIIIPYFLYSVGLGIVSSPINRLVLFSSSATKSSVAALLSFIAMLIVILGIKSMEYFYQNQSNIALGAFGFTVFFLYLFFISLFLRKKENEEVISEEVKVCH